MTRKKEHQAVLREELKNDVVGYFSETTVHGFRYIVEGRNRYERFAWILFIAFGFWYSGLTIYNAYRYWQTHPVETTIDEVGLPVQELPFPAITVCDTTSLKMPRRNRWMFLEKLLNSLEVIDHKAQITNMYPGRYNLANYAEC